MNDVNDVRINLAVSLSTKTRPWTGSATCHVHTLNTLRPKLNLLKTKPYIKTYMYT